MLSVASLEPVDYLVIGHLAQDLTADGPRLGGTAAYAALTAHSLGLRVGVVTTWGGEVSLESLSGLQVIAKQVEHSTTFENVTTPVGRVQYLHHVAPSIQREDIPDVWRRAPIIHIGPIAQEGKEFLAAGLGQALLGITPQGWLRSWDGQGRVHPCRWPEASDELPKASATVFSVEDVGKDEDQIEAMASVSRVLAVTEGPAGARLYWHGDLRRFRAPEMDEVDATGAGDIFAAAFFCRLYTTRDPWEAARFATRLSAYSVTRSGLAGIPQAEEVQACLMEVF
ncbi:MAG: PfkB family carbohydrate kinase [Chloroflexota bacterium]